jgi:hypothetical protein
MACCAEASPCTPSAPTKSRQPISGVQLDRDIHFPPRAVPYEYRSTNKSPKGVHLVIHHLLPFSRALTPTSFLALIITSDAGGKSMSLKRSWFAVGGVFVLLTSQDAWAQVSRRCPSLEGAARAACFASDGALSPTATAQPIVSAAQRCPSLSEPARAACFDADNQQVQSIGRRSSDAVAPVFLGPTCPSLPVSERAACFAADGLVTTAAAATTTAVLCPRLPSPARDVCFASDSANVSLQQSNASATLSVGSTAVIRCPSLPASQREACFNAGTPAQN